MNKAILLAEDYEDDALLVQRCLQDAGIQNPVFRVRDGDEAVAYLGGQGDYTDRTKYPLPSVLFLDLKMPRMSGFDVLQWLQEHPDFKNLLTVVLSGYHEIKEVNRAYALGARSFLVKPCHPQDVTNLVNAFKTHW